MSPRFITAPFRSTLRHSLVGLCLVAHLATTIGFPLPQTAPVEAGSKPFPCQHHHCGCRSAEQCWRSCCCMSMQEKLAWAKKNGVTPPDYVLVAAETETEKHEAGSCCSHSHEKPASCCSKHGSHSAKTCCSAKPTKDAGKSGSPDSASGFDCVLGIHAQKCQGLSTLWVVSGAVLPPPPPLNAPVDSTPPLWWSDSMVCQWQNVSKQPDVPPPRLQ
jgi:hypothetical protein